MNDMSAVTIFTTKLNENPSLFGDYAKLKPYVGNETLADILLKTFSFERGDILKLIDGLVLKDRQTLLGMTYPEEPRVVDFFSKKTAIEFGDEIRNKLWEAHKVFILSHSLAIGHWSVVPANKPDAYALHVLLSQRIIKAWVTSLVSIAKALNPDAKIINLVVHDKDIPCPEPQHVFTEEELLNEFGGKDEFLAFKENSGIEELNLIAFQHVPEGIVTVRLLENAKLDDVNKEVKSIVQEALESRNEVNEKGGNPQSVNSQFDKKLELAHMGEVDHIGNAYSTLNTPAE